jgi:hypothetical protein
VVLYWVTGPLVSCIPTYPPTLQCIFILYPYQAIDRLSKGSLSTDVKSMRTKKLDKCIINEMEEDIRKELKKIWEEINIIDTRHIPLHIKSKL